MATGGPPAAKGKEAEDFRHSCGICMEPYNRRRIPKMLPCFHSFCYPCLTALEASVRSAAKRAPSTDGDPVQKEQPPLAQTGDGEESEAQPPSEQPQGTGDDVKGSDDVTASQDDVGKASFPCPACRAPVVVPEGGVGDLQWRYSHATRPNLPHTQSHLGSSCRSPSTSSPQGTINVMPP